MSDLNVIECEGFVFVLGKECLARRGTNSSILLLSV